MIIINQFDTFFIAFVLPVGDYILLSRFIKFQTNLKADLMSLCPNFISQKRIFLLLLLLSFFLQSSKKKTLPIGNFIVLFK
jgi:hypothetical protein